MTDIKPILRILPVVHSVSLLGNNLKFLKKKKTTGNLIKQGTTNILGVSLIKLESDFIEGF